MGYTLMIVLRLRAPLRFIQEFRKRFTWEVSSNIFSTSYKEDKDKYTAHIKAAPSHAEELNRGSLTAKKSALMQCTPIDSAIAGLILNFSEEYLSELCYSFRVWKDNFGYNVAGHLQSIIDQISKELRLRLVSNNFRITACIVQNPTRYCYPFDEAVLWRAIVENREDPRELCSDFDKDYFPHWDWQYPVLRWEQTPLDGASFDVRFCDDGWIDFTDEVRRKHATMRNWNGSDAPVDAKPKTDRFGGQHFVGTGLFGSFKDESTLKKDCTVKIVGLKSRPKWNGKKAAIVGEYDFGRQRWPVTLKGTRHSALLKSSNLDLRV